MTSQVFYARQDMEANQFPETRPWLLTLCAAAELREVRRRVLLTRYNVTSVCCMKDLRALPGGSVFIAFIICHSIPPEECTAAIREVRSRWPNTPVLAIAAPYASCADKGADGVVGSLAGPAALFQGIATLLASQRGFC